MWKKRNHVLMQIVEGETMRLLNKYVYPKVLVTRLDGKIFIGTRLNLKNSNSLNHTFIIEQSDVFKSDLDTVTLMLEKINKSVDSWKSVDLVSASSFVVKEDDLTEILNDVVGKGNTETYVRYLKFKSRDNIL